MFPGTKGVEDQLDKIWKVAGITSAGIDLMCIFKLCK